MATKKHTPIPWKAVTSTEKVLDTVIDSLGDPICQLHNGALNFKPDNIEANAALIAAAPEMLAMLEKIERLHRDGFDIQSSVFQEIKTIIAKATHPELSK